jgi:hypothetical protein
MALTPPHTPELEDRDAELVRLEHERKIAELQKLPFAGARIIRDVTLADGIPTPVAHGMGRAAQFVMLSPVRGSVTAGRIDEVRDGTYDRAKFVTLEANDYGATITVDLAVL